MKRILKILLGLILLIVLGLGAFLYAFDANDYKQEITDLAQMVTGRSISINGNIDISVYPWIGLKVDNVVVNNNQGFSQTKFASIDQFDIKIKILPLLSKKIEIDELVMTRLNMALEKNAEGKNNWSDFIMTSDAGVVGSKYGLTSFMVQGVELVDANIIWKDTASGKQFDILALNLSTEAIINGQPLPVNIKTRIKSNQPVWQAAVVVKSQLVFKDEYPGFNAKGMQLAANAVFPSGNLKKVSFSMVVDSDVNLDAHTASLKNARIKTLGLMMGGDFNVENIFSVPVIRGPLKVETFEAAVLMKNFDVELPKMKNANSLKAIEFSSSFQTNFTSIYFDKIDAQVDGKKVDGFIRIDGGDKTQIRYTFNVDKIELNDYMPRNEGDEDRRWSLPVEFIRSVDLEGKIDVASVSASDVELKAFNITSSIKDGVLTLNPVRAKVDDSSLSSALQINAQTDPVGKLLFKAQNINTNDSINPWLNSVLGEDVIKIDGIAELDMDLKLKGIDYKSMKNTAQGLVKLNIGKMTMHGVDLDHASRSVVVNFANKNNFRTRASYVSEINLDKGEEFDSLAGTFNLSYGKLTTKDLLLKSRLADIQLTGNIDLLKEVLGYKITLDMHVENPSDIRDKLRDHPMEYNARGTYRRVACDFDYTRYDHLVSRMLTIEAKARRIQEMKKRQSGASF